jgi:hypothetical protein
LSSPGAEADDETVDGHVSGEAVFEVRVPVPQVSAEGLSRPAEGDRQGNGAGHQGQRVLGLRVLGLEEIVGGPEPQHRQRGERRDEHAERVNPAESGDRGDRCRPDTSSSVAGVATPATSPASVCETPPKARAEPELAALQDDALIIRDPVGSSGPGA